jgi:hypothetical protein
MIYAKLERNIEAHLKLMNLLFREEEIAKDQLKELVDHAMNRLRMPVYH